MRLPRATGPDCGPDADARARLRGSGDGSADAEKLWIGHEDGGRPLAEGCERGGQGDARRCANADLRLTAEVGHRQPAAVELPQPDAKVEAELLRDQPGVDADESRLSVHARSVARIRDTSCVATSGSEVAVLHLPGVVHDVMRNPPDEELDGP